MTRKRRAARAISVLKENGGDASVRLGMHRGGRSRCDLTVSTLEVDFR